MFFDYECDKCGFTEEYNLSKSTPKSMHPPDDLICPKCKKGKLIKQFSCQNQSFDIIGSCYMNDYGKHAWKKKMSAGDQAEVLAGNKNPY